MVATAIIALSVPVSASAQSFCPDTLIRIVVPFPAGGPVDSTARIITEPLKDALGQNVVIENRSGASGSVATGYVAQQPGNGCTILFSYDTHGVNPALYENLPFNTLKAFKAVMLIGTLPAFMAVHPSHPWKTLDEVMAAAKSDGNLPYTTGSTGTLAHLAMKRIEQKYDVRMRHVSYRGAAPALADVLGGHVPMMLGSVNALAPSIREGKLRAVMQTGNDRHPMLPDTPTISELGHPGLEVVSWIGAFLPASSPDDLVVRLSQNLKTILHDKSVQDRLTGIGIQVVGRHQRNCRRSLRTKSRVGLRWSSGTTLSPNEHRVSAARIRAEGA